MIALLVVLTFVVLFLGVLVAGLLRSHADILRSLHDLGVGVGDPASNTPKSAPVDLVAGPTTSPSPSTTTMPSSVPGGAAPAIALGPAPAIAGLTPDGDARAVAVDNSDRLTLLGFLSSGCQSCAAFWDALQRPDELGLPETTRVVIVTKGPELEITHQVRSLTTGRVPVVMSTDGWHDYQVPGSPFFVLVDGATGQKIGQGVANQSGQLVDLVRRAQLERRPATSALRHSSTTAPEPSSSAHLDGPAREAANDDALRSAGILPGDPSLYPRTLEDVFPYSSSAPAPD